MPLKTESDERLLIEAAQRDAHRFAELYECHFERVYSFVSRRVRNREEAQDLTQAFFASLLERNALKAAERQRGRFRSFLLTAFQHFLSDEWDKAKAQKRGGGRRSISLNLQSGESRYALEAADASLALTRLSYTAGNVGIIQVLDAQRLREQARLGYVRAEAQQFQDTAQLYLALGGATITAKTE